MSGRQEEAKRFGSRAFARSLLAQRGSLVESGRARRVESVEREARGLQSRLLDIRRRLLPFELLLSGGSASERIFRPGPFSELRCYERRVTTRHEVEYFSFLVPHDRESEGYQPFGSLRLGAAQPLRDLELAADLWARLAREGVHTLPRPRASGPRGGGLLRVLPDMEQRFARAGQPTLSQVQVTRLLLEAASSLERVTWCEAAFSEVAPVPLHRYYLDTDLRLFLVRHEGIQKRVAVLEPSDAARSRGLLIHARREQLP